jgi:hypothetical protein
MKFQEYVLMRDKQIDESWGDAFRNAGRLTNGIVSGVGRTPMQAVRGAYNTGMGLGQTGLGTTQTGLGGIKGVFGGGWDTARAGLANVGRGMARTASGIGQTVAAGTGATMLGRGIVAATTPDNDMIGMSPNTVNTGKWGGFKNWMGWQGRPQASQTQEPTPTTNPTSSQPFIDKQVPYNNGRPMGNAPTAAAPTAAAPTTAPTTTAPTTTAPTAAAPTTAAPTTAANQPPPMPNQPPSQVKLRYAPIIKLYQKMSMKRKPGEKSTNIENALNTLQGYARIPGQNVLDWKKFSHICMSNNIDPLKLWKHIA